MAKEIKLTQESLDAYKEELEYLKTTRADEVAEQLKEARSFGDLSENAEYDEAKNEQGKLYHFVGSQEADPMEGKISDESPFGKAMLGKKVGMVVEVEAPVGIVKYQVMDIKK